MLSSVEIITTPTADTPGSAIVLDFADRKYLIGNIHEGLTRALIERGTRLSKVTDIFITGRTEWKSIGGLLGTVLSVADIRKAAAAAAVEMVEQRAASLRERGITRKKSQKGLRAQIHNNGLMDQVTEGQDAKFGDGFASSALTIHGGINITHSLAAARKFIFRKGMPLRVDEFQESSQRHELDREWKPDWADEKVRVWSMAITPHEKVECGSPLASESPLKRRYEEFAELETDAAVGATAGPDLASADSFAEDQKVRALTVAHMFDSAWRSDQLEEVFLADLPIPVTAKLFMRDQITQEIRPYSGLMPDGVNPIPSVKVLVRKPWPGALIRELPSTQPSKVAMSYIFRNHIQRGKFQPEKAKLLNVPAGPLWRELTEGRSVQSTDGQTISPDMVLLASREGSGLAVVDLPSSEYVQNLLERPEWQAPAVMNGVEMIMWILGRGVGQNKQLQDFMCHHGNLRHIISSQDYCPNQISFDSGASGAIQLHQINPVQHPIPVHNNTPQIQLRQSEYGQYSNTEFIEARRGVKLMLTPSVFFNNSITPPLNTARVLHKTPPDVLELALAARDTIASKPCQEEVLGQNIPSPDAEIICLGTGSAMPSKYRNVSSTLLRVPGSGSYLLDCGENTLGQLRRIYRPQQLGELLRDLKMIWISHLHADHHLGLPSVIKAWYEELYGWKTENQQDPMTLSPDRGTEAAECTPENNSLLLVSSRRMHGYLKEYSEVEDIGLRYVTKLRSSGATENNPRSVLHHPDLDMDPLEIKKILRIAGISELQSCNVRHCDEAQAVSLTFPTGFKFSYSGDCRPSKKFAEIGKDSTVLLHEATFDDEMGADARSKKHSTTSEAIGVGVAMGARRILLTHFSQRYQKLPVMSKLKGLHIKLEGAVDAGDEMDGADPDIALTASGSAELNASITQSLINTNNELTTPDVASTLPQATSEANSVSINQPSPPNLKISSALEETVDADAEMDGVDRNLALTASESAERDASIAQSIVNTNPELTTSHVELALPQATLEADSVSINQPPPSDLKIGIAIEGTADAGAEINEIDRDTSVAQSVNNTKPELTTADVESTLPQATLEADSVSISQSPPSDLKIGIAFDYMRVRVGDIIHLEKFTPALMKLFEEPELDKQVGAQEEDAIDQNKKGDSPLTPKKMKLKQRGGTKAERKTGEGTPKKSPDGIKNHPPRKRPSGDEQAELECTTSEASATLPQSNMDSVST